MYFCTITGNCLIDRKYPNKWPRNWNKYRPENSLVPSSHLPSSSSLFFSPFPATASSSSSAVHISPHLNIYRRRRSTLSYLFRQTCSLRSLKPRSFPSSPPRVSLRSLGWTLLQNSSRSVLISLVYFGPFCVEKELGGLLGTRVGILNKWELALIRGSDPPSTVPTCPADMGKDKRPV